MPKRGSAAYLCTGCGETQPDKFGIRKTSCLECRREWGRLHKRKIRADVESVRWERALVILGLTNAWKPPKIHGHGTG